MFEKHNIVMFTDPGAEIDDEILMYLLMKTVKTRSDVYFVCVPGMTSTPTPTEDEINLKVNQRIMRVRDIFPERFGNKTTWRPDFSDTNSPIFTVCSYEKFITGIPKVCKMKIDVLLHVAPLWHIRATTLNALEVETRIFMGDLSDPSKSINGSKAIPKGEDGEYLMEEFTLQEEIFGSICKKTISIPTSFARQVPTPIQFINTLPSTMSGPLLDTAFSQFVGRPDPSLPWAEDISVANHATILKMLPSNILYDILLFEKIPTPTHFNAHASVALFLKTAIGNNGYGETASEKEYFKRILHISLAVLYITKVPYDGINGFNEDALTNKETAKQNWLEYITRNNCNLTPFYDGLAWVVMQEGSLPSLERCHEIITSI